MSEPALTTPSDNALLMKVAGGDHAAFALFYDRVSGPLYSMALRMLGNEQEAQDALQEGMEHLWTKAPGFDSSKAAAFSWAVMLFRSRLIDRVRRRASQGRMMQKVAAHADAESFDDGTAIDSLARQEDCFIVRRVMAALKTEQRELLQHAFFSGQTQQEIAENTGRPLGTVKTVIRRALIELRERLTREGYEP
ncbi:MAG: sigK [Verrucomicrobiaceae bacterium]|nr:sigK [Verrucomicrobiaceae bacterium]